MILQEKIADWKSYPNALGSEAQAAVIVSEIAHALGEAVPETISVALKKLALRGTMRDIANAIQLEDQRKPGVPSFHEVVDVGSAAAGLSWTEAIAAITRYLDSSSARIYGLRLEFEVDRGQPSATAGWGDPVLQGLFNDIAREILEGGWDRAYDRWVGSFDESTTQSSGSSGDGNISVIPGTGGACTETVLVLLKSRDWPHGFHPRHHGQEMDTLRIHLVECQKVRRVLIISDTINMPSFDDEYLRWIRAWSARGVAFAHALVAPDRRTLLPIPLGI
jgi:hypothetical protein